jgi:uncharacterized membrane protein
MLHYSPLLIVHISGGITGLLAGAVALAYRKGSVGHAKAGIVFVIAMFAMAGAGTYLAIRKEQLGNICGGIFTLYMVSTALVTVRRKSSPGSKFDWLALLAIVLVGLTMTTLGILVVTHNIVGAPGVPIPAYFIMGSIAFISGAADVRMILRRTLSRTQRITRHLVRMCFGLFIASGSFFLGQQRVFPEAWRGSPFWLIPGFLPLAFLLFWLIRVRFTNAFKRKVPLPPNTQPSLG